jgi:preprotein translocase subunit SecD
LGVSEASVQRQGANRIAVQLPGVQDAGEAIRLLGKTATLEVRLVSDAGNADGSAGDRSRAFGHEVVPGPKADAPVLLKRDVVVTGEQLTDATSSYQNGEPSVSVRLDVARVVATRCFARPKKTWVKPSGHRLYRERARQLCT